ncbi:BTAD domain-containing putative transcriptional regulator [Streptomyces sp. ICBB 8177]|uniref:AfsR/SARP family transcriptional regulator n=1 Tax=Streptomyces sp. ICBB 8177 TaxID=563922 RepID=UPI000D67CB38|nr:BTAD domain-containing putative transcriptional regulator [Streptomyces sp. ICBB 8177]PWI44825.1 SARP family transcriptional regulator [Streptomyces sp. ICBB 8177]
MAIDTAPPPSGPGAPVGAGPARRTPPGGATAERADGEPMFRVLGALEVRGPRPVAVTARRQQIVLALLLLGDNRPVRLETMVHAVWGSTPPTTARAQIQTAVSALRRGLERAGLGNRIRMQGLGYTIDLAHGELDLHHFDDLVARGRQALADGHPVAARAAFREALGLWSGEPLPGADSDVVQAKLVGVAERRFEVLEECLDVELRIGLHHEVLGEIRALVSEFPLRERPAGQLMLALYRCGRQAEALGAYRAVRRTFVEELGLEPSPALHRLHLAILNGSADLDPAGSPAAPAPVATMPVPRMLPARVAHFTGDRAALERLCRRLAGTAPAGDPMAADAAGHVESGADREPIRVAVVSGRAGVGKSVFAAETAHELAAAFPDGQLYAELPHKTAGPEPVAEVLERFLRALGFTGAAIPEGLDSRAALYRSAIAKRRALIVVENVADADQLRALVPGTPTCRLLVTSRARLSGPAGTAVVELDVPSAHEGVEMLAAMAGADRIAAEPSEAIDLVELCDGLPLALRIAAARLSARPHWSVGRLTDRLRDETRRLDELSCEGLDVRAPLTAAHDRLPSLARVLFARLSGLPRADFAAWTAAPLLDVDPGTACDVLEALVDARLVDVIDGDRGTARYRLRGLVRLFAAERLADQAPEAWPAARRRMLGAWLALADEAVLRLGGVPLAEHGDPTRSRLERSVVDEVAADPAGWYVQERGALTGAVREAAKAGETAHCWHLALAIGALAEPQQRWEDWRESHATALWAARRTRDRLGEAALLHSLGVLDLNERRWDQATARLRAALAAFEQLGAAHWRSLASAALERLARERGPRAAHRPAVPGAAPVSPVAASGRWSGPARQRRYGLAGATAQAFDAAHGDQQGAGERRAPVRHIHRPAGNAPSRHRIESREDR